ncbi:MAG: GNAT family N-acetyltransferase [Pseudomonadota bacterium]
MTGGKAASGGPNGVRIRWAGAEDAAALVPVLAALHAHDVADAGVPEFDVVAAHAERLLDGSAPHRLVIAQDGDGRVMGLAAVAIVMSISDPRPGRCRQMDLKELFVMPGARGAGIGTALMAWIEVQACALGAGRIDWHVKRDNHGGIAFYRRFGADIVDGRLSMRKTLGGGGLTADWPVSSDA